MVLITPEHVYGVFLCESPQLASAAEALADNRQ